MVGLEVEAFLEASLCGLHYSRGELHNEVRRGLVVRHR
jgi:hypothetical protein